MFVLLVTLFVSGFQLVVASEEIPAATENSSPNIDPACYIKVDPNGNPLEQLLDHIYYLEERYGNQSDFWVSTPNRAVPLIRLTGLKKDEGFIRFEIPHRIDMDSKYSKEIDEAVETRSELPFAAYRFVRNVPQDETVDIALDDWILYHARLADAGKYGQFLCYNVKKDSDRDCGCMPIKEFAECLRFYKPNKVQESEAPEA
jgi:hypothetical protein